MEKDYTIPSPIKAVIDRIENDTAIILLEDGQKILISKEKLPPTSSKGDAIYFEVKASLDDKAVTEHLAKTILNQLLKT